MNYTRSPKRVISYAEHVKTRLALENWPVVSELPKYPDCAKCGAWVVNWYCCEFCSTTTTRLK